MLPGRYSVSDASLSAVLGLEMKSALSLSSFPDISLMPIPLFSLCLTGMADFFICELPGLYEHFLLQNPLPCYILYCHFSYYHIIRLILKTYIDQLTAVSRQK